MTDDREDSIRDEPAGDAKNPLETLLAYQETVFRICLGYTQNYAAAEDLTQEVYLKAYQNLASLRYPLLAKEWLFRIAKNISLDHQKKMRTQRILLRRAAHEPEPSSPAGREEYLDRDIELLKSAIRSLPKKLRAAFVLREYGHLTYQELANVLGLNRGTVMSRLSRARQRVAAHFRRKPMTKPERRCDEEAIKKLIEAQEKSALSRFRSSHFRERLETRIQTAGPRTLRPSFLHAIPSPAWISLAFLALLGSAFLMHRFFLKPGPKAGTIIERFLRQLPAMQALESQPRPLSGPEVVRPSLLEKLIADALASPALSAETPPKPESHERVFPQAKPAKPQGLREIYDILLIDKSVERVLTAVYEKEKEG